MRLLLNQVKVMMKSHKIFSIKNKFLTVAAKTEKKLSRDLTANFFDVAFIFICVAYHALGELISSMEIVLGTQRK